MAQIPTQQITVTGTAPTLAAAAAGDTYQVGQGMSLRFHNASGAPIDVTQTAYGACSQGGLHPLVTSVAAGGDKEVPAIDAQRWTNPATGLGLLTYSATASLTRAAVQS